MKRVIFSRKARTDIDHIFDYTAERWGPDQAARYTYDIQGACGDLATGLRQGRPVDVRPGYLKYTAGAHVVYFRDCGDRLEVIRVLHGRMDVGRHL